MSTNPDSLPWSSRVTDETARRLLARAIEIDSRRAAETSLADLWRVADEAGISRTAFDTAVREMADEERGEPAVDAAAREPASAGWLRKVATRRTAALAGALFAIIAAFAAMRLVPHAFEEPAVADVQIRVSPGADYQRDTAATAP